MVLVRWLFKLAVIESGFITQNFAFSLPVSINSTSTIVATPFINRI